MKASKKIIYDGRSALRWTVRQAGTRRPLRGLKTATAIIIRLYSCLSWRWDGFPPGRNEKTAGSERMSAAVRVRACVCVVSACLCVFREGVIGRVRERGGTGSPRGAGQVKRKRDSRLLCLKASLLSSCPPIGAEHSSPVCLITTQLSWPRSPFPHRPPSALPYCCFLSSSHTF